MSDPQNDLGVFAEARDNFRCMAEVWIFCERRSAGSDAWMVK